LAIPDHLCNDWQARISYPVVGGAFGALACLILPTRCDAHWYWSLPLVVDFGCFGGLIAVIPVAIIRRLRR
jgi:hypothetical protein